MREARAQRGHERQRQPTRIPRKRAPEGRLSVPACATHRLITASLAPRSRLRLHTLRAYVHQSPHRQPRRHRLPHDPHAASAWASRRWRSTPRPTRTRCTCVQADEAVCIGPAPAAESYLRGGTHPRGRPRHRRAGDPSRLRLPVRERRLRRGLRAGRASSSSARARADARLRPQAHGARAGGRQRRAAAARLAGCSPTSGTRGRRPRASAIR